MNKTNLSEQQKITTRLLESKRMIENGISVLSVEIGSEKHGFALDSASDSNVLTPEASELFKQIGSWMEDPSKEYETFGVASTTLSTKHFSLPFRKGDSEYSENYKILDITNAMKELTNRNGITVVGLLSQNFLVKYKMVLDFDNGIIWGEEETNVK